MASIPRSECLCLLLVISWPSADATVSPQLQFSTAIEAMPLQCDIFRERMTQVFDMMSAEGGHVHVGQYSELAKLLIDAGVATSWAISYAMSLANLRSIAVTDSLLRSTEASLIEVVDRD